MNVVKTRYICKANAIAKNPKNEEDEEQIELILEEANAYGLRQEVKEWAENELEEASFKGVWLSRLDAYVRAHNEWIK